MKRRTPFFVFAFLLLLTLLLHRIYGQSFLAAALLGLVLVISGVLGILKAPKVWSGYLADYKKLPAAKKQIASPNKRYYYINRYFLFPLIILAGIFSWYVAYLIYTINT